VHFRSEREFLTAVLRPLKRRWPGMVYINVPSMSRCVDITVRMKEMNEIITVELKLTNWRRALRQARDHLLAADRSYVCIPNINPTFQCIEQFRAFGVGLLTIEVHGNGYCMREILPAPQSRSLWSVSRNRLIASLLMRTHV